MFREVPLLLFLSCGACVALFIAHNSRSHRNMPSYAPPHQFPTIATSLALSKNHAFFISLISLLTLLCILAKFWRSVSLMVFRH